MKTIQLNLTLTETPSMSSGLFIIVSFVSWILPVPTSPVTFPHPPSGLTHIRPNRALLKHGDEKKVLTSRERMGIERIRLPGIQVQLPHLIFALLSPYSSHQHMDPEEDPSQFSRALLEQSLESALTALRSFISFSLVLSHSGQQICSCGGASCRG
jgi:hypothetical protein